MSGRKARALWAAAALAAAGCERASLTLSLGLDAEDKKAQSWLGYYPSAFEPVGACPSEAASIAEPVVAARLEEALKRLEKTFAVQLPASEATAFTGKPAPAPDPAAAKSMEAELALAEAAKALAEQASTLPVPVDTEDLEKALAGTRKAAAEARGLIAPGQLAFLVRGVSFDPARAPKVTVCYGDVQLADAVMGSKVPKMWRQPMVVWVATPVRRGRVMVDVTQ